MDTTPTTTQATPMPGAVALTYPDGAVRYVYTDELDTVLAQPGPAPVIAPVTATAALTAAPAVPAARPALVEPWMVRGTVGLGLAGGTAALAPVAAEAAASFSSALGSLLHIALQVGGIGLAALLLVRLLTGRKTRGGQNVEVIQTVTQVVTQSVKIGD